LGEAAMNIRDIAKICGVSPSTVSKILHNKDQDISIETRKRVLEVIKEYQYVPYSKVIKSVSPKTSIIGVVLTAEAYGVQEILYGIERTAADNGYSIMVCNTDGNRDKAIKCMNVLENKGVDGIIAVYQEEDVCNGSDVPAVCIFDHKVPSRQRKTADIYYEMSDLGYMATNCLIKNGHHKIGALLTHEDTGIEEGYYRAFKESFLSPIKEWIFRGTQEDIINIGINRCLNSDLTAIVCTDTEIGNVVYDRLRERGDMIPGKVSVISARDSKLAEKMKPKLTAVSISPSDIGKTAVESIIQIIEGKKPVHECRKKIEAEVIIRDSVDAPSSYKQGGKLVVVGSMNMDCVINVSNIPTDGETLRSRNIVTLPG